ncbi:MAG: YheU family protein [Proteobacteria bacterium]|nr:YheU family protein [Pseudomonadota bacterium]
MEIPFTELSDDALRGIIEEYITREGTEYGSEEFSLQQKIAQVREQLLLGKIKINFDADSQTCNLVTTD